MTQVSSVYLGRLVDEAYQVPRSPVLVTVPDLNFLAADGEGSLDGGDFQVVSGTLLAVSRAIAMTCRDELGLDVPVSVLEALWQSPDGDGFAPDDRLRWSWTAMVRVPEAVAGSMARRVLDSLGAELELPALGRLRELRLSEGRAAQCLHIGSFREQHHAVAGLHAFVARQGLRCGGHQHEIYLSDPLSTAPQRQRTIIRQPVRAPVSTRT